MATLSDVQASWQDYATLQTDNTPLLDTNGYLDYDYEALITLSKIGTENEDVPHTGDNRWSLNSFRMGGVFWAGAYDVRYLFVTSARPLTTWNIEDAD